MKTLNWRIVLPGSLLALLGFGFGSALGRLLKYQKTGYDLEAWLILLFPALMLLGILWHEFGHAFGGWLAGFQLRMLAAGPLRVDLGPNGYRFSLNRSLSLWGGVASSSPRPGHIPGPDAMRRKILLVVAGGPLASLAGGLLALPAWLLWETSPNWAVFCALLAFTHLSLAISTLIPLTSLGFHSDGQRLLDLVTNNEAAQRWVATTSLGALALESRPRDWPQAWVEAAWVEAVTADGGCSYDAVRGMWLRHQWHLDRHEYPHAQTWLERALAKENIWPTASRPLLHASAATFFARHGNQSQDLPRARKHLTLAQRPGFLSPELLALTEAIVLQAEGKADQARALGRQAQSILDQRQGSSRQAIVEDLAELGV
jgi:hypothetical protein